MTNLGVKRKDLDGPGSPCAPSCCGDDAKKREWDDQVVYPTIDAWGQIAKILPVDQMKPGVEYTATVKLQLSSIDGYGKKEGPSRVSIEVHAISDLESPEPAKDEVNEESEEPAAQAVLLVMQKKTP